MTTVAKTLTAPDLAGAEYDFGLYINGTDLNDNLFGSAGADESTAAPATTFHRRRR